jgi:hypothetical protein
VHHKEEGHLLELLLQFFFQELTFWLCLSFYLVLFPSSSDATTFPLKTFVSLTFAQIYSDLNSDNVVSRALLKIKLECLSVTDTLVRHH